MRTYLPRSLSSMVVAALVLLFGLRLLAAPVLPGPLLIQAYTTLEQADHDYKGHRLAAMKQVEAAGKLVGVNVRGDGKGHEPQGVSDAQLRTAQSLLEQARAGLTGVALRHVNQAIAQISTALAIK